MPVHTTTLHFLAVHARRGLTGGDAGFGGLAPLEVDVFEVESVDVAREVAVELFSGLVESIELETEDLGISSCWGVEIYDLGLPRFCLLGVKGEVVVRLIDGV